MALDSAQYQANAMTSILASHRANCHAIYADTGYANIAVTFPILIARTAKVWGTESPERTIPEGNLILSRVAPHCRIPIDLHQNPIVLQLLFCISFALLSFPGPWSIVISSAQVLTLLCAERYRFSSPSTLGE